VGLENVEKAVLAEARAEAGKLLAEARGRLAERLAAARREIDSRFDLRRRRELAHLESEHQRELARARTAARLEVLREKNRLVERAFRGALERLAALPRERFLALAGEWLAEVPAEQPGAVLAGERERGWLAGAFLDRVNAGRTGKLELSAEPGPEGGGLVVRGEKFEFDLSWAGQLADRRGQLSPLVAAELFGDKAQP